MKRSAFMKRVRAALAGTTARPRPTTPSALRLVQPGDDLVAAFLAAAPAVGVIAERVTRAALAARVGKLVAERSAGNVVFGPGAARRLGRAAASDADLRATPDVAVTEAELAIAETATLGFDAGARSPWLTIAAVTHVVIVDEDRIVADLIDALVDHDVRFLVTGPSKTADIEGVLVTGVHGPAELLVLLVDADRAAPA